MGLASFRMSDSGMILCEVIPGDELVTVFSKVQSDPTKGDYMGAQTRISRASTGAGGRRCTVDDHSPDSKPYYLNELLITIPWCENAKAPEAGRSP